MIPLAESNPVADYAIKTLGYVAEHLAEEAIDLARNLSSLIVAHTLIVPAIHRATKKPPKEGQA